MFQSCLLSQPRPPPDLSPILDSEVAVQLISQSAFKSVTAPPEPQVPAIADNIAEKNGAIQLIYQFLLANGLKASASVLAAESHVQRILSVHLCSLIA